MVENRLAHGLLGGCMTDTDRADAGMTRRRFLQTAAAVAGGAGASVALAACGSSASPSSSTTSTTTGPSAGPRPRRGGTLRAAISGGSSSDTLDAQDGITEADFARLAQLYDPLVTQTPGAVPQLVLAEEITPNTDATTWTIRLRKGVTFHNGRDLTAEDVMYSFLRIANPKKPLQGLSGLAPVDLKNMKKLDTWTVQLPCPKPYAILDQALSGFFFYYYIVPVGYDPKNPIGTGPFKYKSFVPGSQSTCVRNENYWQTGLPYLDAVVATDYSDETSQVNAMQGGQADVADLLTYASVHTLQTSGLNTLISPSGTWTPFTMRVDVAPLNDVKVRQALRLVVDRPQMRDLLFGGNGVLGNDLFGIWDPSYDKSIAQRQQDIGQAKSLLKSAGHEGLSIQLVTADVASGTVQAATVFAQQAAMAGVTVSLRQVTVTEFYGKNYLQWAFAQDYWSYAPYLVQVGNATLPSSPYNECHFDDPHYTALYEEAIRTVDEGKRTQIIHEMQEIDYNTGGYIIPYFVPIIDGFSPKVHGLQPSKVGIPLSNFGFGQMWMT